MAALYRKVRKAITQQRTERFIRKAIDDDAFPKPFRDLARNFIELQEKTNNILDNLELTQVEQDLLKAKTELLKAKTVVEESVHNLFRDTIQFKGSNPDDMSATPYLTASLVALTMSAIAVDIIIVG